MAETSVPYKPTTRDEVKDKRMLITEIHLLLNEALQKSFYPHLKDELCVCQRLEGDLKKYGDYQCTNILSVCEILRAKDSNLFEKEMSGPRDIAEEITKEYLSEKEKSGSLLKKKKKKKEKSGSSEIAEKMMTEYHFEKEKSGPSHITKPLSRRLRLSLSRRPGLLYSRRPSTTSIVISRPPSIDSKFISRRPSIVIGRPPSINSINSILIRRPPSNSSRFIRPIGINEITEEYLSEKVKIGSSEMAEEITKEYLSEKEKIGSSEMAEKMITEYLSEKEKSGPSDITEEITKKYLFEKEKSGPRDIAQVIIGNFRKTEMIKELTPHDIGILTFGLDGHWIAKRLYDNLKKGIDAWAPISRAKKVIVDFSTPDSATKMHADGVRSRYIKDTLVRMLEYSKATVIDKEITEESRLEVEKACEKAGEYMDDNLVPLWSGIKKQKVDWIVFVTPLRQRDYIMKRFDTATRLLDEHSTTMSYLGYHTSRNEHGKLDSFRKEYKGNDKARLFWNNYGEDAGYTNEEEVLECHLKYTYLKKNRFSDCTLKVDEMFKEKENNFANQLKTQALIRSAIKDCGNKGVDVPKEQDALVGKQRELGLQLLQFTEVIEESFLTFMPHLVCEYVWSLSKNVTRYLENDEVRVRINNTKRLLCEATKAVMEKCFDILGITPKYLNQQTFRDIFPDSDDVPVDVVAVSPVDVVASSDARPKYPNSRFELFSMFIGVSHSNFEKGNLFGNITLSDTYGLLSDSWCKIDENDRGHVAYFDHDWHDSVGIYSTSFLSFGNPSSLHSVPFSSSIEIGVHLFVTTEKNDACYQLCNYEHDINLSQFCEGEQSIERGTFNVEGKDGSVSIYYVLLKDALDISMTLEYKPVVGDPKVHGIRGRILAYYGGDFLNTCDGFKKESYKALIFHIEPSYKLETGPLPLKKSQLAVPTNGVLVIEAFLEDVDSKNIIVNETYEYRAEREGERKLLMGGINCRFELTVDWIRAETKPMGGLEGARPPQPMAEQPSTSKSK